MSGHVFVSYPSSNVIKYLFLGNLNRAFVEQSGMVFYRGIIGYIYPDGNKNVLGYGGQGDKLVEGVVVVVVVFRSI